MKYRPYRTKVARMAFFLPIFRAQRHVVVFARINDLFEINRFIGIKLFVISIYPDRDKMWVKNIQITRTRPVRDEINWVVVFTQISCPMALHVFSQELSIYWN